MARTEDGEIIMAPGPTDIRTNTSLNKGYRRDIACTTVLVTLEHIPVALFVWMGYMEVEDGKHVRQL